MKIGMWATHSAKYMPLFLYQLRQAKLPFEVSENAKWETGNGWAGRFEWYHGFARRNHGTIMILDPWDHLLLGNREIIEDRVDSFYGKLVWSADRVGYPKERSDMPQTGTSYRYPNIGAFVGDAAEIAEVLDPANIMGFGESNYDPTGVYHAAGNQIWLDLVYIQDLYARGVGVLDYNCRLFQTLVGHGENDFTRPGGGRWIENKETDEWPLLFHAEGKSRFPQQLMDIVEEYTL